MKTNPVKRHDRRSPDFGNAFVPDVARTHKPLADDCAESFAEEFIEAATSAEAIAEHARDEWIIEEVGGPFLEIRTVDEMDLTPAELNDWRTHSAA
jgi:hypothetical protein